METTNGTRWIGKVRSSERETYSRRVENEREEREKQRQDEER